MSDGPRTLTQYSPPVLLHPRVWTFLLSSTEGPIQEVTEADARLGEALADGREMRVYISLVHGDHLLRLVGVQGLVILLIPAARLGLHAIPDRRRGGDGERLVGPVLGPGASPCGAIGI